MAQPRLLIVVDMRTTFTGYNLAQLGEATDGDNPTESKYPREEPHAETIGDIPAATDIVIDYLNKHFEHTDEVKPVRWGLDIQPHEQRIKCLKLFMKRKMAIPQFVSTVQTCEQLARAGRNIQDACTDYLAQVWKHAMAVFGNRWGHDFVALSNRLVFMTTAGRAGMGANIKCVNEPHAAATGVAQTPDAGLLRLGENFAVVDAGGGTVELAAFAIVGRNPLRLHDLCTCRGSSTGSVYINVQFERYLSTRLHPSAFASLQKKNSKTLALAMADFEGQVKPNLREEGGVKNFMISLPGVNDPEVQNGVLMLPAEDAKGIFRPTVDQIIADIQDQITRVKAMDMSVSSILLTGVMGQSQYLRGCIRKHSQSEFHMTVFQPEHSWTATVRGALLEASEI